jgi:uncharacterized protein (TIGR03437 family)
MGLRGDRGQFRIAAVAILSSIVATGAGATPVSSVVRLIATPDPVAQGQTVTITAGVNWTAAASPTGTIAITATVQCPGASVPATTQLATVALGSSTSATPGVGTTTVSSFPCAGQNSLVGAYSGDSNYTPGNSQPLIETVTGQLAPTMVNVTATPNPATAGQSVTLAATLTYTSVNNTSATGSVTFRDANTGAVIGAGNVQTSGSGRGSVTSASYQSPLTAGSYAVQAIYSGDSSYAGSVSPPVTEVVTGTAGFPVITSIVTTQGARASQNAILAQNTWIEVHGADLSAVVQDWSKQDFSNGLPIALAGVTVTVNNIPAAISYVSATQVNLLTPIDGATGQVPVQLNTPFGKTAVFSSTMLPASPSFLVMDAPGHVAARHADYSLAGPASLSAPGYPFTSVKPGETVLLYGVGFGQTAPAITDQLRGAGLLPTLPTVTIGGVPATIQAAGISAPGLYQLNVIVPPSAQDGDLILSAMYNGYTTQPGVILTVQH